MSAFPPHRSIPSIPVSPEIALKYLSSYISATKTSPHLLPNARLEASGPSAGSSSSSVTIHNLQRVEAGLRGEWLAPILDLEEGNVEVAQGMDDGTNKGGEGEGWIDLDQYQREQSIEGPGQGLEETMVGDMDAVEDERMEVDEDDDVENEVEIPKVEKSKRKHGDITAGKEFTKDPIDKAARKKEKADRLKAEKKVKEEKRKRKEENRKRKAQK